MQKVKSVLLDLMLVATSIISSSLILISLKSEAKLSVVQVHLNWTYKSFTEKVKVYNVTPMKAAFISETANVQKLAEAPVLNEVKEYFEVTKGSSKSVVLVIENSGDKDIYFFAVPHEVHPAPASAGHFFECLCVGKVFKIAPKSVWYRIVRVNLNSSFQDILKFDIEHQIVGLTEAEFMKSYKDRLYKLL